LSRLYPKIIHNTVLPLYDVVRGTQRKKCGDILAKTQWLPRKEIESIQTENLRALIKHAYDTVPYYHAVFKDRQISPDDIKNVEDLSKIPVLTKQDIIEHRSELVSTAVDKRELVASVSGGTGNQINFFVTKDQMSWELAAEFRGYDWAGYQLGDKCVNFWGSPIDMAKHGALMRKVTSWIERVKVVSTYILSDDALKMNLSILRNFKPEVIKGYASSVYMVAKYLKENGVSDVRPSTVLTSAEMLQPEYRSVIEEVFGCRVFDHYGSREIGALAIECEEHHGFHINSENVVMEFIRDNEPVVDESGLLYVTNLRNFGMPFIRYEIGDVGTPSLEICSCGRGLPMMESLEGRSSQFMAVYDQESGKVVPVSTAAPGVISNILMHIPVESYRIIQESLDKIVIQIVAGKDYSEKDTDFLVGQMHGYLGDRIAVEVVKVDFIPPLPSGKRSVFISKLNAFKNN
jgi:phenylacetate-CoA ligase